MVTQLVCLCLPVSLTQASHPLGFLITELKWS